MVSAFVLCLAGGIGFRLYSLQVAECDRYRARADGQHRKTLSVPATRGAILDRDGGELAVSVSTTTLYAHPNKVTDATGAANELAEAIGASRETLYEKLASGKSFVYLGRFLDDGTTEAIRALDLDRFGARAFGYLEESRRRYPRGRLASHVVGYASTDGQGLEGVEGALDDVLSGEPSVYLIQQDGRNRRVRKPRENDTDAPADPARDVILSIDRVLQHIVERELERAIEDTGARAATAVLLDPRNGEVLALANWPTYDANRFEGGPSRANRAVEHYYEPGSTFKIVPLAAALERNTVRVDQRFDCEEGVWTIDQRTIHDVSPHGVLSLHEVIEQSSNIGMVKVTMTLQPAELHSMIEEFGFGSKTGIELPGESPGILRREAEWSDFTQASLAFGQEIGVTVLQMASAFGVIANDGVLARPHLVLGSRGLDGRLVELPDVEFRRVISASTARAIGSMLEGVVANGSGKRAAVPGFRLAGKSGTAQKAESGQYSDDDYMASFGGFGPSHAPRLVGLVVLDSPRGEWIYGGQVAAPVFGRIMADALRHLRTPYDDPPNTRPMPDRELRLTSLERARSLARRTAAGSVPDLSGLGAREAVTLLAYHGYAAHVEGAGVVTAQTPLAGTRLASGETCRLVLKGPRRRRSSRDKVMEASR